jgi:hypothetical protein
MRVRIHPGHERVLLALPGLEGSLREHARAIESRIVIPPGWDDLQTFSHSSRGVTVDHPSAQAGIRGPGSGALEFGTRRLAPRAPVRRAAHGG